jgi:hypothetical protein
MLSTVLNQALATLADEFAALVAARVVASLRQGSPGMIDQANSPLGRRRHCYAVRQRLADGKPGAAVVGRRHLLSREALDEELSVKSRRTPPRSSDNSVRVQGSVADELRRELAALERRR